MTSQTASDPAAPQTSTVLVATSDSTARALLRRVLDVGAIEIVDASDGLEALALARRLELDLIVLDAFLAVMDGISVCGRIRALTDVDQPPIIIVGLSSERAVEIALDSGADDILTKPLNPALIRHRTRRLLTRRQEERRLRLMEHTLEAAPLGITLLDARTSEYSVLYANPGFERLSGYAPGEIQGRNLRLLRGPETDVAAMTDLRDAMGEGRASRMLLRNYRKDGSTFWNDLATAPLFDAAGRLTHFVAAQHDVSGLLESSRKGTGLSTEEVIAERTGELQTVLSHIEERRRFTETILNAMVSGILVTDQKGTVTFANLAALRTLGASLADCVGRSVVDLFGYNDELVEVIAGRVASAHEHRLDFPLISPGGTRFYVGMSITPAPAELQDEVGFIFLFRNLAETIEDEADPRLLVASEEPVTLVAVADEGVHERGTETSSEVDSAGAPASEPPRPRRITLSLRYCSPSDLVRRAADSLAPELELRDLDIDCAEDLPEVLLDRQQIVAALAILIGSAVHRCGAPDQVHVRLSATEGGGTRATRREVHIEIAFPRALITEHDMADEAGMHGHLTMRREDLVAAEKLVAANGGRLVRPVQDSGEQSIVVALTTVQ
jgi:PAS domain S-box-containing protein